MTEPSRSRLYTLAVMGLVAAALFAAEYEVLLGHFLFADDGAWVSAPLQRELIMLPEYRIFQLYLYAVAYFTSVPLLRLSLLVPHALAGGLLYLVFRKCGHQVIAAALLAIAVATLPAFSQQHVFISASHVVAVFPVFVGAVLSLMGLADHEDGRERWKRLLLALVLLLVAARISPVATIAGLIAPLAVALSWRRGDVWRLFAALAIPVIDFYLRTAAAKHTYFAFQGWVDFSLGHILGSTWQAASILAERFFKFPKFRSILFAAGLAGIIILALKAIRASGGGAQRSRAAGLAALLFVAASALTFGPTTVLAFTGDRYYFVPALFLLAAGAALVPPAILQDAAPGYRFAIASLAALICGNLLILSKIQSRWYAAGDDWLRSAVTVNAASWLPNAQVAIVMPGALPSNFGGVRDFSNRYIQLLAQRPDVVGIAGWRSEADWHSPFKLAGDSERFVRDGLLRMRRMFGLAPNRPAYVYFADAAGKPQLAQHVGVISGNKLMTLKAGQSMSKAEPASEEFCTELRRGGPAYLWPMATGIPVDFKNLQAPKPQTSPGRMTVPVGLKAGDIVEINILISGAGKSSKDALGEEVLMAPGFAIHAGFKRFSSQPLVKGETASLYVADNKLTARLEGVEGCGYVLTLGKNHHAALPIANLKGEWLLSAGRSEGPRLLGLELKVNGQASDLEWRETPTP